MSFSWLPFNLHASLKTELCNVFRRVEVCLSPNFHTTAFFWNVIWISAYWLLVGKTPGCDWGGAKLPERGRQQNPRPWQRQPIAERNCWMKIFWLLFTKIWKLGLLIEENLKNLDYFEENSKRLGFHRRNFENLGFFLKNVPLLRAKSSRLWEQLTVIRITYFIGWIKWGGAMIPLPPCWCHPWPMSKNFKGHYCTCTHICGRFVAQQRWTYEPLWCVLVDVTQPWHW